MRNIQPKFISPQKKKNLRKLQMNEHEIFLQALLCLMYVIYFEYRSSQVQITYQNIQG